MMLLLSTVDLSDLYLNMELLLLLISPTTLPMTWRISRSVPSPLSILLLHAKMHALAKTGITSFKQSCENACVNVKKRVSPENPTFSLIQSRIVQSSLAYCQHSDRSFITLPSDTDFCTNFVQMSVAVLYLPNIFFKLLMRQVPVHGLVALLQITLSRSQLLTGHFKQLSKVILKYLALSCSVSLGGALLRQSEMTFFPGPYRTSRSHLVNL